MPMKCGPIPQRYVLAIMGCCAIYNAYTMRTCLSITITEMVVRPNETYKEEESCPIPNSTQISTIQDDSLLYKWDEKVQGLILSSFFWGYCISHFPGAVAADVFGGKYILGVGIYFSAIFTLCTPWVIAQSNGNWVIVVIFRMLIGLFEGLLFPAMGAILGQWMPPQEVSLISSVVFSGSHLGTIVGISLGGTFIALTKNWKTVFYAFGAFSAVWFLFWQACIYSNPESHPCITKEELDYIQQSLAGYVIAKKKHVPWCDMLLSLSLWALVAGELGHDWAWFTMVTVLPKYMRDVLKFSIEENALWSSIPFFLTWMISLMFGYISNRLIKTKYLSIIAVRKIFCGIGYMGPACFLLLASYANCNKILAVTCFCIAMGLMGAYYCSVKANAFDISPNFAGTVTGISHGIGSFAGVIAPWIAGVFTINQTIEQWRSVYWICFFVLATTCAIFLLFSSGDVERWNTVYIDEKESSDESEK